MFFVFYFICDLPQFFYKKYPLILFGLGRVDFNDFISCPFYKHFRSKSNALKLSLIERLNCVR
ncbi:hypothetical protein Xsto_01611 [Xenorhabdus stockiae]|uniref:Uncharacterized protein n=1 Tax=Xenorhabdus stockiae TaxID=351614 RepID=A0A2D0KR14_9GAMM|nr:hypothetical protein Xsto_01611 [Xenorhabdus stockiae]PHM68477.1 hypothetical protein Xekj_03297 [Xenorhabdus sp. KJ12.1]